MCKTAGGFHSKKWRHPRSCHNNDHPCRQVHQRETPGAILSAHDLDETQLDETCPNCAGDHDENQVVEYSDGSDSSDSQMDIY